MCWLLEGWCRDSWHTCMWTLDNSVVRRGGTDGWSLQPNCSACYWNVTDLLVQFWLISCFYHDPRSWTMQHDDRAAQPRSHSAWHLLLYLSGLCKNWNQFFFGLSTVLLGDWQWSTVLMGDWLLTNSGSCQSSMLTTKEVWKKEPIEFSGWTCPLVERNAKVYMQKTPQTKIVEQHKMEVLVSHRRLCRVDN